MIFVLKNDFITPEYYAGGSHMSQGTKEPNITYILDNAKKYKTEQAAINAINRINKYSSSYLFYIEECTGHNS